MSGDVPKRQCFVALFDILGFKDIVETGNLKDVWRTYSDLRSSPRAVKENLQSWFKREVINIETFSDTFLIYTSDFTNKQQNEIDEDFDAVLTVCDVLFHSANNNAIPIRGAITAGELIVDKGIYIGEPIVEAYKMEKQQDWIGCWIDEKAIKRISKKRLDRQIKGKLILSYNIPFSNGDIINCYVYNWVNLPFSKDYDNGVLKVKPWHDWPAERKHRNTRDFIKYVNNALGRKNK